MMRALRTVALAALAAGPLAADIQYMVDYVLPRGGQRGAMVTVEFHGRSLENPKEILFYESGIAASGFEPYAKPGDGFKVKFQIAKDCALGEHVLRVHTATALSDAVTFWVGPFPQFPEAEVKLGENDTMAKAQPVLMNSTIEGQILPGAAMDVDYYRTAARKGQRISVEVEAARLGTLHYGGENDLAMRILDAAGKELARDDDSTLFVQDPMLSILAPEDGTYFVEVKQQVFYPPRQGYYRLHIGDFSRPTAIFPAGGQKGATIEARVLGDPAGERTVSIPLPGKEGRFDYFAGGDGVTPPPSGNELRVSSFPNVLYAGKDTVVAELPSALNGILKEAGESDTYKLHARKGQAWVVRVYARTLGAPVDARIWVKGADGQRVIAQGDDSRLSDLGYPSNRGTWYMKDQQDPVIVFRPPADGDYVLGVEDAENQFGPDHVYRVEITPLGDSVIAHLTGPDGYQMARLTSLAIPRGSHWTLDLQLAQGLGNTFRGPAEIVASGLPTGVHMSAPALKGGENRVPIQFTADETAQPCAALIQLQLKPSNAKAEVTTFDQQGMAFTNRPGELPWHFVFVDKFALAVTDPAPFDIALDTPAIALAQGGDLTLHARITRRGDFKGPVEMVTDWLPPGVSKSGAVTIPPDKTEATLQIQANDKAAKGTYKIAMNATTTGGDGYSGVGRVRVSSGFVELKVAEPYFSIDLQRGAVEQGKEAVVEGTLRIARPFGGQAKVMLQQLPKGVTQVEPAVATAADTKIVFRIKADRDALAGLYKGVKCEIVFEDGGQKVTEHSGNGTLRVDESKQTETSR